MPNNTATVVGEAIKVALSSPAAGGIVNESVPVWSHQLHFEGASYISPHFDQFDLPEGAVVVVRSPDGQRSHSYTGRGNAMANSRGFWGIHIAGDSAVIELFSTVPVSAGAVTIDRYARGFENFHDLEPYADDWATKAICGSDDSQWAKCYESSENTIYNLSRPVARLLINGTGACTGWLVGSEGHLMTNHHCIDSDSDAANTNYEFMAEGSSCSTNCASWGACSGTVVSGASLVKANNNYDYALVKLSSNVSDQYGYLQLRASGAVLNEQIYIPQHPQAWGKRIAVDAGSSPATVTTLNAAGCGGPGPDVGYYADTQGGSSGSPVIARSDNLVVALHHCANCANRGVNIQDVINNLGSSLPASALPSTVGQIQFQLNTSKCLHKKYGNGNWSNGNPIHLWDCSAGESANKTWIYDENTGYIRGAENPSKCIHKKYGNWNNGNPIHVWDCSAGSADNKTWTYDSSTGYIRAANNTSKCIHKKFGNGDWSNGNPVHLWDCSGGQAENKTFDIGQ